MKATKIIVSIALLICLSVSLLPYSANAADSFGLPCDSTTVTAYYRYWNGGDIKNHGVRSNYHNAIDFGCLSGDPIYAVADGTVSEIGYQSSGFGNYLVISHGTLSSLYGHLKFAPLYQKGDYVTKGTIIGYAGSTGNSSGPHLHFELYNPNNKSQVTDPLMQYYKSLSNQQLRIGGNSYRANKGQNDSYAKEYTNWLSSRCIAANGDYIAPLSTNAASSNYWTRTYKFKSAKYSFAYSNINGKYIGQAYTGDMLTVKAVYYNSRYLLASCPWGKGTKDIYLRYEDTFISAPRYANAYSSQNGNYVGRIYPGDSVRLLEITSDGWCKVLCPWTGGINKLVWCRANDLSY
jgi:hypothetical protein